YDLVEAVLAVSGDRPVAAARRARSLQPLLTSDGMAQARRAFERVANLADKATSDAVEPGLFQETAEAKLYAVLKDVEAAVTARLEDEDAPGALEVLTGLAPTVDDFFEHVLVM